MMNEKRRIKLIQDVFKPRNNETVLILIDVPHSDIHDNQSWQERREMADEWFKTFKKLSEEIGFLVEKSEYLATGVNNKQIPNKIKNIVRNYNLVIAMTEYSATASLIPICKEKNTITRCASMPGVERRMEDTSLKSDYLKVRKYALAIKKILNNVTAAEVEFSNGDNLFLDLRNRLPLADLGECSQTGQSINLPSGETCIVPYEAAADEIEKFGKSKTKGFLPVKYNDETIRYSIKNNYINEVIGKGIKKEEMQKFFNERKCRSNIAELGIGCNPNAVVTGNILEDEKVPGLHIAYGMSTHIGGKIPCDMHQDICYPKGAPIEATTLTLIDKKYNKIELIDKDGLRFDLIE